MPQTLLEEVRAAQAALEAKREASRKRSIIDAHADDVLELAYVHHVPARIIAEVLRKRGVEVKDAAVRSWLKRHAPQGGEHV